MSFEVSMQTLRATTCFSIDEIARMRFIVKANMRRPDCKGAKGDRDHVTHCLHQLIRFAHQAGKGPLTPERQAQFFLNVGRAQEILESCGGVEAWWRKFYPLVDKNNWSAIIDVVHAYLEMLGLPRPTEEFISKL